MLRRVIRLLTVELAMKTRLNEKILASHQKGAALIALVFVITLVFLAYTLYATTGVEYKAERDLRTAKALVEAKSALLGWSVLQNNPGQLPCPEDTSLIGLPTEGQAKSSCTLPAIGRLPWRTLGLGDIRDGNGDKLWYVISSGFRNPPINSNTLAQLAVDGTPNSAVAILFSVGIPLAGQSRPSSNLAPAAVTQYLEGSNNDGDNTFVSNGAVGTFNDRLLVVKQSELFSLVTNRILRLIRGDGTEGLVKFYPANSNKYPFADINADGDADNNKLSGTPSYNSGSSLFFNAIDKATLLSNQWFPLISYVVSPSQQQVTLTLNSKTLVVP